MSMPMRCMWAGILLVAATEPPAGWGADLSVTPPSLTLIAAQGTARSENLTLRCAPLPQAETVPFTATPTVGWIVCDPAAGNVGALGAAVRLDLRTAYLPPGTHTGRVSFAAAASNAPLECVVAVQVVAASAVIRSEPAVVRASVVEGTAHAVTCDIEVWNGSGAATPGDMPYELLESEAWIAVPQPRGHSTGNRTRHTLVLTNLLAREAGTYRGSVIVTAPLAANDAQVIPVVLEVQPAPKALRTSTNLLVTTCGQGGWASGGSFQVANAGPGTLHFDLACAADWVHFWPTNGTSAGADVPVFTWYDSQRMPVGTHAASIVLRAPEATNAPVAVGVMLTVTSMPKVIAAAYTEGSSTCSVSAASAPVAYGFDVWNAGSGAFRYTLDAQPPAPWLSVTPTAGTATSARARHTLTVNPAGLPRGEQRVTLTIWGAAGDAPVNAPWSGTFVLRVASAFAAAPAPLTHASPRGSAGGAVPLQVWNTVTAGVNADFYTVTWDDTWLSVAPAGGMSGGETNTLTVTFNAANLPAGVHRSEIHINGTDQTVDVPVFLSVTDGVGAFEERLVFGANLGGDMDLWTIAPDGSGLRPLLRRPGTQGRPQLSPNGKQVLFHEAVGRRRHSVRLELASGHEQVYKLLRAPRWQPDSGGLVDVPQRSLSFEDPLTAFEDPLTAFEDPLTAFEDPLTAFEDPLTAFENPIIAFENPIIAFEDPLTAFEDPLTAFEDPLTAFEDPLTAFENPITARIGGGATRLTGGAGRKTMIGVQRGTENLFCFLVPAGGSLGPSIVRLHPGTGRMAQVLPPDGAFRYDGAISPDGRLLAYARARGNWRRRFVSEIAVLDLQTGRERVVVQAAETRFASPCFAPDGKHLAFTGRSASNSWLQTCHLNGSGAAILVERARARADTLWGVAWARLRTMTPVARVAPTLFALNAHQNATNTLEGQFAVWNGGDSFLQYTFSNDVPWLATTPRAGTSTGEHDTVTYEISPYALAQGSYTGRVHVLSNGTNPVTSVEFRLTVGPPAPRLFLLGGITAGARFGAAPFRESLPLRNIGGGSAAYHAVADVSWISIPQPDGENGGEVDDLQILVNPTGLGAGTYRGHVTVTVGAERYETLVVFTVATDNPQVAMLGVTPTNLVVNVPRYRTGSSRFDVFNAGGGVLRYYIEESVPWLSVQELTSAGAPASCAAETDTIHLELDSAALPVGAVRNGTVDVVQADGARRTVRVALTVTAPEPWVLTVRPHVGGAVTVWPLPLNGGYTHQSLLLVQAAPEVGYALDYWIGPVTAGKNGRGELIMDADKTIMAHFVRAPLLYGRVTNSVTGAGVPDARVRFGDSSVYTDVGGNYRFAPAERQAALRASRAGYTTCELGTLSLGASEWRNLDIGLAPGILTDVRVSQESVQYVDIDYKLAGRGTDRVEVRLAYSVNDGRGWTFVPLSETTGDVGAGVRGSLDNAHISWKVTGRFADGFTHPSFRVRLQAWGQKVEAAPFALSMALAHNARLLFWIDKNLNGVRDLGEAELAGGAEVYYGGRTADRRVGTADAQGGFACPEPLLLSRSVFARKHVSDRGTEKENHGCVEGVMRRLWFDSDQATDPATWNGRWKTRLLTDADLACAHRGEAVSIQLAHPLFEWNLTFDSMQKGRVVANLLKALPYASRHLYQVTHGQMKFDKFYISSAPAALTYADVYVQRIDKASNASVGGVYWSWEMMNIEMDIDQLDQDAPTVGDLDSWGRTLAHEFGHYGLSFWDEYRTDVIETGWRALRQQFPDHYPAEYGLMDHQGASDQMSSSGDYLLSWYPALHAWEAAGYNVLSGFSMWAWYVKPNQHYAYNRSCWDDLARAYRVRDGATGIQIDFIKEKDGYFEAGKSWKKDAPAERLFDRQGPRHFIPGPYDTCRIRLNDGPWLPGQTYLPAVESAGEEAAPSPADLVAHAGAALAAAPAVYRGSARASCDGQPAAGAVVSVRSAVNRPLCVLGRTGRDGALDWDGELIAGDALECRWRGRKAVWTFAPHTFAGVVDFDLSAAGGRVAQALAQPGAPAAPLTAGALTPGQFGLSVGVALDATHVTLRLHASRGLRAPPVVATCAKEAYTSAVPMTAVVGNTVYEGRIPVTNGFRGRVEIACTATDGQTLASLDEYRIWPLGTNQISSAALSCSEALRAEDRDGVVYAYRGPVPFPAGGAGPSNQVGDALSVGLTAGRSLDAERCLRLHAAYPEDALTGLDAASLQLCGWTGAGWTPVSDSTHDPAERLVTASVTNLGLYALFAHGSPDATPPAGVADLSAVPGTEPLQVALAWTAPGDDGANGTAAAYELRYAQTPVTTSSWASATVAGAPAPLGAGASQTAVLNLPSCLELYHFALRAVDEAGNRGPLSNVAAALPTLDDADGDGVSDRFMADAVARAGGMALNLADDTDGDGLTLWDEYRRRLDPFDTDSDGDGMNDGYEVRHGLDAASAADRDLDPDGDTLSNLVEAGLRTDPRNRDSDGDGMPDDWEVERGLDPLTLARGQGGDDNLDGDPAPNLAEFVADTDPTNAASFLFVAGLSPTPVRVHFASSARRLYTLRYATNLAQGVWEDLSGQIRLRGTGGAWWMEDTSGATSRFYRVRVEVP